MKPRVSESLQEYAERTGRNIVAAYPEWHRATLADGRNCLGLTPEDVVAIERNEVR